MQSAAVKKCMIVRRTGALFKKAEELSALCGLEIGIVIVSPTEMGPIVWRAVEVTTKRFLAFMAVPEGERVKRMVLHEEYMRARVNEEIGKMRRLEEEVERKEMNLLMKGLYALADDKMVELEKRKQDLLVAKIDGVAARPPPRCRRNRHERNHRATAPAVAAVEAGGSPGSDGGGSYYVPQPPAPPFDSWWTTPPAPAGELLPIPNMAAPLPLQGGRGDEGSYQHIFSTADNGGGNSGGAFAGSSQDWAYYNFFPWSI